MKSQESSETYLETILVLSKSLGAVRSVDIANELDYTKASVSVAMKNLRENGHIVVNEDGYIHLTQSGQQIAETIYERHRILTSFLTELGVDEKTAADDACRIEHVISSQSFERISEHYARWKQYRL